VVTTACVLRAAAQRIADEIDNPHELMDGDGAVDITVTPSQDIQPERIESYLPSLEDLAPRRRAHYLKREDLHKLVWTAPVSEVAAEWVFPMLVWRKHADARIFQCQVGATGPR
jgi:hypothetical protein